MRGPKPIPVGAQIARGDPQKIGKNKLKEKLAALPKAQRGFPPPPEHLSELARKTWDFLAEQIEIMNQDRRPDALMLEGCCVAYARAVKADRAVERDGITIELSTIDKESGERIIVAMKANPAVKISSEAWMRVRAFCTEFGLTPSSLTRLKTEKPDDGAEDLAELLSAPREPRPAVN